ncbi:MAG: hypothetical protein ABI112_06210 [Terracoccus sp.]
MHWTEPLGFATGAFRVWLMVRRSVWNFPIRLVVYERSVVS